MLHTWNLSWRFTQCISKLRVLRSPTFEKPFLFEVFFIFENIWPQKCKELGTVIKNYFLDRIHFWHRNSYAISKHWKVGYRDRNNIYSTNTC